MVVIDADVLLIDRRYRADKKFAVNQQFFSRISAGNLQLGITMQALLEAVGCMSFGTPTHVIVKLPRALAAQYCLWVVPDLQQHTMHSDCTIDEIMIQIAKKMSLGDAIQVAQIVKYAPGASCFVTWNAKHFLGKLAIPVLTPAEWLAANP